MGGFLEMDSNPRSLVAGRGQAARNQIFRTTTGAEAYVRRNKAANRLMRRAPDQPSRNLPPPPFLFRHRRGSTGAANRADSILLHRPPYSHHYHVTSPSSLSA